MSVTLDVDEPIPGLDADGRPDPGYAARLGLVPARAGRRSAAFALDALAWVVLAVPEVIGILLLAGAIAAAGGDASAVAPGSLVLPLVLVAVGQGLLVVFGTVQLVLHGRKGLTLGKGALGIRSVNVARFGRPGFWRVVLRVLVLWASQLLVPVVGPAVLFASSTWDPEQRGRSWLDRIGRCYAVDVRRGLDPLDAKALRHARRAAEAVPAADVPRPPSLASDRPVGDDLFIPSARSSSGVVSASAADGWTPPELVPAASAVAPGAASAPVRVAASTAPAPAQAPPSPAPAQAPPSTRVEPATWVLVFDDGSRVVAAASGLLGRGPAPAPGELAQQLVPILDDSMRISKTHAAFGVDGDGFWIADRASRNGTVVDLPGGGTRTLAPGSRTPVPAGARVTLGGRSFTVTQDSGRQA